jgi:hypothetical protein
MRQLELELELELALALVRERVLALRLELAVEQAVAPAVVWAPALVLVHELGLWQVMQVMDPCY